MLFADLGATVIATDRNAEGIETPAREKPASIQPVVFDQADRLCVPKTLSVLMT
jgi:hypothetical protein